MHLRSIVNIEGKYSLMMARSINSEEVTNLDNAEYARTRNAGRFGSKSASNRYDFETSIFQHLGRHTNGEHPLKAFRQNLEALLPKSIINCHPTHLQMAPTSWNSSDAINFLDLTLFMVSNNCFDPDSDASKQVYQWIRDHSNAGLFEYLLSVNGPTVEALAEQLFYLAIEMDDATTVKTLLDSGLDPHEFRITTRFGSQVTPFQRACQLKSLGLVRVLLDAGADVNDFSPASQPPLVYAITNRDRIDETMYHVNIELVRILLNAGADVNPDVYQSPLWIAARNANVELVSLLIAAGADPKEPDYSDGSPLMDALKSGGHITDINSIARQLLQAGVDVNACGTNFLEKDNSALKQALHLNSTELVQILLDAGARITEAVQLDAMAWVNLDTVKLLLRYGARITRKAIEAAAGYGESEVFWFLLDLVEDNIKEESRCAALIAAIEHDKQDLINALSATGVELRGYQNLVAAIRSAVERGDLPALKLLLNDESPYRALAVDSLEDSLVYAVHSGQRDVIDLLLTAGADLSARSFDSKSTPLKEAIVKRDAELAQKLLAGGAAVNGLPCDEISAENLVFSTSILPAAVSWGDYSCIRPILDAGVDVNAPDSITRKTALTVAVEKADFLTTQLLVENGADVNALAASSMGYPALAAAVRNGDMNMVHYLLTFGADVDEQVLIAAVSKSQDLMQMLLTTRLTRSRRYPQGFGCRALQHAIASSNAGMIQLLLSNGIDPNTIVRGHYSRYNTSDINTEDDLHEGESAYGDSALGFAIRSDKSDDLWVITMLLRGGANPNGLVSEIDSCKSALTAAIDQHSLQIVKKLLKAGADVNMRITGRMSQTPLQRAALLGTLDIAVLLLAHGADVNASPWQRYGATALQFAAIKGYLGIASVLVEKGADVNAARALVRGRTALEGAAEHGRIDMLQFLLNAGAQIIGSGSVQYERARKFASQNGHIAARRLLERNHSQQLEHQTPSKQLSTDIGMIEDFDFGALDDTAFDIDDSVFDESIFEALN